MPTPIIFDTDAGTDIDDLFALALILASPNLELLGITTVSGNVQARARLCAKMLRLAGREFVPVYAGISTPAAIRARGISDEEHAPRLTHTQLVTPGDSECDRVYGDAVDFILDQLSNAQQPITLVGTGPWSNLAAVLERTDVRQRTNLECIALMGGEIHRNMVESNIKHDPEAADVIIHSGVPQFLATWSVSRQLTFTMEELATLWPEEPSPFIAALRQCTDWWWGQGMRFKPGPVCYDIIPVFWAAGDRDAIQCLNFDPFPVELRGEYTRGAFVFHPWKFMSATKSQSTEPGRVTISDEIDADALKHRYAELVFRNDSKHTV